MTSCDFSHILFCLFSETVFNIAYTHDWLLFAGPVFNPPSIGYLQEGITCFTYINYIRTHFQLRHYRACQAIHGQPLQPTGFHLSLLNKSCTSIIVIVMAV